MEDKTGLNVGSKRSKSGDKPDKSAKYFKFSSSRSVKDGILKDTTPKEGTPPGEDSFFFPCCLMCPACVFSYIEQDREVYDTEDGKYYKIKTSDLCQKCLGHIKSSDEPEPNDTVERVPDEVTSEGSRPSASADNLTAKADAGKGGVDLSDLLEKSRKFSADKGRVMDLVRRVVFGGQRSLSEEEMAELKATFDFYSNILLNIKEIVCVFTDKC